MKKIMGSSIKFKKVMVSILLCLMMVSMVSTPVSASVDSWNTFRNTMGGRSGDYEGWLERTIESSHATLWDEYDNGGVRLDNYQTWLEKHDAVKAAYQSWMEETYVGADHAFLDGKYNEYINGMYAGGAIWVPSYYDWLDGLGRDSYTAAYQEYINGGPSVPDSGGLFTGRIDLGIDWGTLIFGGLSYKDTVIKHVAMEPGSTSLLSSTIMDKVKDTNPIAPLAISLIALYFVIEVIQKSTSLDKINLEMIVKLLLRLLIAKILVDNATEILVRINGIIGANIRSVSGVFDGITEFNVVESIKHSINANNAWGLLNTAINATMKGMLLIDLGKTAGLAAIATAAALAVVSLTISGLIGATTDYEVYIPTSATEWQWFGIVVLVTVAIRVIVNIGCTLSILFSLWMRDIEIIILAMLAPLAMAGFVSDEFKGATKKYLMHFAAICVQGIVIAVIINLAGLLFPPDPVTFANGMAGIFEFLGLINGAGSILSPIMNTLYSCIPPVITAVLLGKARGIAQMITGG